jgi:hypothetical protein
MKLHEIAPFDEEKLTPPEELEHLKDVENSLLYQLDIWRTRMLETEQELQKTTPKWTNTELNDPVKREQDGYFVVYDIQTLHHTRSDPSGYYKITPNNSELISKLGTIQNKVRSFAMKRGVVREDIRKCENRIKAWRRKQIQSSPTYVSKSTGKALLDNIKEKVGEFLTTQPGEFKITNPYYWAKNKMIVIEISVPRGIGSEKVWETASKLKVALNTFISNLGYTQFRVIDFYSKEQRQSFVRLQLDDVEARDKTN